MAYVLSWSGTWEGIDQLAAAWELDPDVALRAQALGEYFRRWYGKPLYISSGGRSRGDQIRLREMARGGSPGVINPATCSPHVWRNARGYAEAFDAYPELGSWNLTESELRGLEYLAVALGFRYSRSDPVHFDTGGHLDALSRGDRTWCI